jgi:aerobic-type carbon monoxide dehydrogenase small subunit (CoxS/CutS family)
MMTLAGLLTSQKNPSASELSEAMSQVLCRCGTYHRIRQAALMAIDAMNQ